METARCQGTKRDGSSCLGRPLPGEPFCFAHSPTLANQRAAGRREGGAAGSTIRRAQKRVSPDLASLLRLIYDVVEEVRDGAVTPAQGSAIASLARAAVAVTETGRLETDLESLRSELDALKGAS